MDKDSRRFCTTMLTAHNVYELENGSFTDIPVRFKRLLLSPMVSVLPVLIVVHSIIIRPVMVVYSIHKWLACSS